METRQQTEQTADAVDLEINALMARLAISFAHKISFAQNKLLSGRLYYIAESIASCFYFHIIDPLAHSFLLLHFHFNN
jgi:hypothetical protein